jgi:putative NIF3 family GTP cyclohydrolase 1 type 2
MPRIRVPYGETKRGGPETFGAAPWAVHDVGAPDNNHAKRGATMNTDLLVSKLDEALGVAASAENLLEFAVTDDNRGLMEPDFLAGETGLVLKSSETVKRVFTAVFITARVVEKLLKHPNSLVFTHHHFDYHEDDRGLEPIAPGVLESLRNNGVSLYVAHAPLDTHPTYGTSLALAELCGVEPQQRFYDYFGAPVALFGRIDRTDFESFAESVRTRLERPCLTLHRHRPYVERLAVVAGGGDLPDLLQMANDHGCDTLLTGTVENRFAVPVLQKLNREFHELNGKLELNLIGGTHFGTERPAMIRAVEIFEPYGVPCEYCEDEELLSIV